MRANSESLTSILQERGKPDALVSMEKNFAGMLDGPVMPLRLSKTAPEVAQQIFRATQRAAFDKRLADLAAEMATMLAISPYSLSLTRIIEREQKAAVTRVYRSRCDTKVSMIQAN